jgi:hypothetical protein
VLHPRGRARPRNAKESGPAELIDAFVDLIERRAEAPCPAAERPARIAALEKEVEGLRYAEEVLLGQAALPARPRTKPQAKPPAVARRGSEVEPQSGDQPIMDRSYAASGTSPTTRPGRRCGTRAGHC